jgi:serine phosphatase RsbU (regulator of sigma subunit)
MHRDAKPGYIKLVAAVIAGLLLGIVLLVQTVGTYYYVAGALVRQEAQRDADRTASGLSRAVRLSGANDGAHLAPIVTELLRERPQRVAWIRIVAPDGTVLAESGKPSGAPYSSEHPGVAPQLRLTLSEVRDTEGGKVLVTAYPLVLSVFTRVEGSEGPASAQLAAPATSEIAIFLEGVSVSFRRLRQNMIIGCSAAIALLASVLIIGLRFPRYLRGKQYEEELELARGVQADLLPSRNPLSSNLDFAAECLPAWQVGGDLYDVFEPEHGRVALVLGDVSGKGLPAALLMALIHGAVRSNDWTSSASNHEESTQRLNRLLCEKSGQERFASLFWCYYDQEKAVLRYINAGHLPPLLIRRNAPAAFDVRRLEEGGMVLGIRPGAKYHQSETVAQAGDLLVIFSDGISEAANAEEEEFGEERLLQVIEENWEKSSVEICDAILARIRSFLGRRSPQDDQTLMVARLQPISSNLSPGRAQTESVTSVEKLDFAVKP